MLVVGQFFFDHFVFGLTFMGAAGAVLILFVVATKEFETRHAGNQHVYYILGDV